MNVYIDTEKWVIKHVERESPFFMGENFVSKIRIYFDSTPSWFPTLSFLKSNGRKKGPFGCDASGTYEVVIDGVTWYAFEFTISTCIGLLDCPGELLCTLSVNMVNDNGDIIGQKPFNFTNTVVKTSILGDGNVIVIGDDPENVLLDAAKNIHDNLGRLAAVEKRMSDLKQKSDNTVDTISEQVITGAKHFKSGNTSRENIVMYPDDTILEKATIIKAINNIINLAAYENWTDFFKVASFKEGINIDKFAWAGYTPSENNHLTPKWYVDNLGESKVSKRDGYGLSKNDLTDELLAKLNSLFNYNDSQIQKQIDDIKLILTSNDVDFDTLQELVNALKNNTASINDIFTVLSQKASKKELDKILNSLGDGYLKKKELIVEPTTLMGGFWEFTGSYPSSEDSEDMDTGIINVNFKAGTQKMTGIRFLVKEDEYVPGFYHYSIYGYVYNAEYLIYSPTNIKKGMAYSDGTLKSNFYLVFEEENYKVLENLKTCSDKYNIHNYITEEYIKEVLSKVATKEYIEEIDETINNLEIEPNKYYNIVSRNTDLTIVFKNVENDSVSEFMGQIYIDEPNECVVNFPEGIRWKVDNNSVLNEDGSITLSPKFTYIFSILNNLGLMSSFENESLGDVILSLNNTTLSWDAVENADGYEVYCDNELVSKTTETFVEISNYVNEIGRTYTIKVVAISSVLTDSLSTIEYTFTVQLSTPINLILNDSGVLSWDMVENATAYKIYDDNLTDKGSTIENYIDLNQKISRAGVHHICVKAFNYVDGVNLSTVYLPSEYSNFVEFVRYIQLTTPINLVLTNGVLSWDSVINADTYNIYSGDTKIGSTTSTAIDLYDLLTTNGTYQITIKASNSQDIYYLESTASAIIEFTKNSAGKLAAPTNLTKASSYTLSWDAVENADGYNVYYQNTGDENYTLLTKVTSTTASYSSLTSGSYNLNFVVTAIDSTGTYDESDYSNSVNAVGSVVDNPF